jgi:hypothetical protein
MLLLGRLQINLPLRWFTVILLSFLLPLARFFSVTAFLFLFVLLFLFGGGCFGFGGES